MFGAEIKCFTFNIIIEQHAWMHNIIQSYIINCKMKLNAPRHELILTAVWAITTKLFITVKRI